MSCPRRGLIVRGHWTVWPPSTTKTCPRTKKASSEQSAHNVRYHGAGAKHFHHHVVGDLELAYESVDMISEFGLTLTVYAAEPSSSTAHALDLLASWAATQSDRGRPAPADT